MYGDLCEWHSYKLFQPPWAEWQKNLRKHYFHSGWRFIFFSIFYSCERQMYMFHWWGNSGNIQMPQCGVTLHQLSHITSASPTITQGGSLAQSTEPSTLPIEHCLNTSMCYVGKWPTSSSEPLASYSKSNWDICVCSFSTGSLTLTLLTLRWSSGQFVQVLVLGLTQNFKKCRVPSWWTFHDSPQKFSGSTPGSFVSRFSQNLEIWTQLGDDLLCDQR